MALTICNCVLQLKDLEGTAFFSNAELSVSPRKSQMNSADALYISRPMRSLAQPGLIYQDIHYIAVSTPEFPITITYTPGGTAGAEVVTVIGTDISVQIQSGVSTAANVLAAVQASVAASALVYSMISGTAGAFQVSAAQETLEESYCFIPLAETVTNNQEVIFSIGYTDGEFYNNIIFDPIQIPDQSYLDISTITTISRG